jgi:ABC-type uncharacterized transport system fused permease/ATPase subunit
MRHSITLISSLVGSEIWVLTTGYNYLIVIIPSLVIAPLYFAGKVEFGVITQASMAFGQVLGSLSNCESVSRAECFCS